MTLLANDDEALHSNTMYHTFNQQNLHINITIDYNHILN